MLVLIYFVCDALYQGGAERVATDQVGLDVGATMWSMTFGFYGRTAIGLYALCHLFL